MPEPFRILQFGFGSLGKSIAKEIIQRENLSLVGLIDINPEFSEKTVEEILSLTSESSTRIYQGIDSFSAEHKDPIDVAVVATSSALEAVLPTILDCIQSGIHVVSICEELSYPFNRHPKLAEELDKTAKKNMTTILGTGINPGYLMDLLPIVLSAPCQTVESITVTRHMNSSHRRFSFQKKIGTGMTEAEFRKNIDEGHITGHVGLVESIRLIDSALHLDLDTIDELPPEPVIAESEVSNEFTTIQSEDVLGLKSTGIGKRDGKIIVKLDFFAYAEATPEYDAVEIEGHPSIHSRIEGGVQGDYGTIGMILNLIPLLPGLSPGLKTMKDIPVPRNTSRMFRK